MGIPKVAMYPSTARFRLGGGRVGGVRYAADIKVGIAGRRAASAASVPGADIPALLREGTPEALGGQLDFKRNTLGIRNRGVGIPPQVNGVGRCVLSVVAFGKRPPRVGRR